MQQNILIIGTVWVEPNSSAAGSRMLQLIEFFLAQQWKVTFASATQKTQNAFSLEGLGVAEVAIQLNHSSFDELLKQLNPTIVLFDRFLTEEQFGWRVVEHCPDAFRILDTEDLHCLRKVRQECYRKNREFSLSELKQHDITKREIASILRSDLSLIISAYEMELLQNEFRVDSSLLYYLPFLLPKVKETDVQDWNSFEDRIHFVFIGNFYHQPNTEAVVRLKSDIWPKIRKHLPKAELHIYGAYVNQRIQQFHKEKQGFFIKGYTADKERVMSNARVLLAPLYFGAGIKGKLTDAMQLGTPSVTTSIGAEGICEPAHWPGLIADNPAEFAALAIRLYIEQEVWKEAQNKGITIINTVFDKEAQSPKLLKQIENLSRDLSRHRQRNFIGSLLQHQTLQATKYMSKWIEEKNKA